MARGSWKKSLDFVGNWDHFALMLRLCIVMDRVIGVRIAILGMGR